MDKQDTETTGQGFVDFSLIFKSTVFVINKLKLNNNFFALFARSYFDSLKDRRADRVINTVFIST